MKFKYMPEMNEKIIRYEEDIFKKYLEIIKSYTISFLRYNCVFKVGIGWSSYIKNVTSDDRLSFKNGYRCYIYCNIEKDGEIIRYKDKDGEVDYYELAACWNISLISRFFFRLNVELYEDTSDVTEEMDRLLKIVASI